MSTNETGRHPAAEDIVAMTDRIIRKWFIDTATRIESEIHPEKRIDMLCVTAMSIGMNYSDSILLLLENEFRMPVKALLRTLCELSAKLAWVLIEPKDKSSRSGRAVEKKIKQWEKYSEYKSLVILQSFLEIAPESQKPQLEKAIAAKKATIGKLRSKRMPRTTEIFAQLPTKWRVGIYPRGFLQFCNSIHIDLATIAGRIEQNGPEMTVYSDSNESREELSGYCLSFMYTIINLVRQHFGWETDDMNLDFVEEYERHKSIHDIIQ